MSNFDFFQDLNLSDRMRVNGLKWEQDHDCDPNNWELVTDSGETAAIVGLGSRPGDVVVVADYPPPDVACWSGRIFSQYTHSIAGTDIVITGDLADVALLIATAVINEIKHRENGD
jgi:hypothetical protein